MNLSVNEYNDFLMLPVSLVYLFQWRLETLVQEKKEIYDIMKVFL